MSSNDRRRLLTLVAIVVIGAVAFCVFHAHDDGLDPCAQALAVGSVVFVMSLLPFGRFVAASVRVFSLPALELGSPPPRG